MTFSYSFVYSGLLKKRFDVTGDGDVQVLCKSVSIMLTNSKLLMGSVGN